MDYNTKRNQLIMAEYGRNIQQMVEHCLTIEDRAERLSCAKTIVETMANMVKQTTSPEDFHTKLWNHLAAISNYKLDIDYPVEIVKTIGVDTRPARLPYPQHFIQKRNYGSIIEDFTHCITDMEDSEEKDALTYLVANHMKRDLSNWSTDTMSDEKVADDMAAYTQGAVQLDIYNQPLISDGELLSTRISTSIKKKKKK